MSSGAKRLAVVIPGMMGSILCDAGSRVIWSDSIADNYHRVVHNPAELQWTGVRAAALSIWKYVKISGVIPFCKMKLWDRTLHFLQGQPDFMAGNIVECPYDWRQSLQESAVGVCQRIAKQLSRKVGVAPSSSDARLTFVTHSMGGLLLRVALGKKILHPAWVERIVHMAPPLLGAPVAFRSLVEKTTMPLLNEIVRLRYRRNYPIFAENMYRAFRTFPSMYELMPPKHVAYILKTQAIQTNPLAENCFVQKLMDDAMSTHALIAEAEGTLSQNKVPVFVIATHFHGKRTTDQQYRVQPLPPPARSYRIVEKYASSFGDGTVLMDSAASSAAAEILQIANVEHALMPNSKSAVNVLRNCGV